MFCLSFHSLSFDLSRILSLSLSLLPPLSRKIGNAGWFIWLVRLHWKLFSSISRHLPSQISIIISNFDDRHSLKWFWRQFFGRKKKVFCYQGAQMRSKKVMLVTFFMFCCTRNFLFKAKFKSLSLYLLFL